ncbi:HAUS augmin-like complex subunit 1 isoform 1-T1 [Podargus strigoides]
MEEKLKRVTLWLQKIYGNEPIPKYEMNARTVDILYELVECNEATDGDVSLLIENMNQEAAKYEAEAKYLECLLMESLGLSPDSLSEEGTRHLNDLVHSAMTLETKDTSLASFFCAISYMSCELYATEKENRELERELRNMRKKLTAVLKLEEQLQEDLKKTEELLEKEMDEDKGPFSTMKFLQERSEYLKMGIEAAEKQLADAGFDESLTHKSLVSLSEKLTKLEKEMEPVKKKLESYLGLPPNLLIARVKTEELRREVDALEEEFSQEVEKLAL